MAENQQINQQQPNKRRKDNNVRMYVKMDPELYDDLLKLSMMDCHWPSDEICYLIRCEVNKRKSLILMKKFEEMLSTGNHPLLNVDNDSAEQKNSDFSETNGFGSDTIAK